MRILSIIAVCGLIMQVAVALPMWGPIGHSIVGSIAQNYLDQTTSSQCNTILDGQTLAEVSYRADQVKNQPAYAWSYNLHFINTPDWACNFSPSRDCSDDICVYGAILNYTSRLQSQTDPTQLNEAMKFLVHFIGDIHQPLHCGFGSDEGGNKITGQFNGYNDNLHAIWDTWIIEERIKNDFGKDQSQYLNYLVQQLQGAWNGDAQQWAKCANTTGPVCPDEWANESSQLACQYAYTDNNGNRIETGFSLGTPYYDYAYPVIDMQLAKAGIRLAATFNSLYAGLTEALKSNKPSHL